MTKTPKIYKKTLLFTVLENQQISKITNVEKHRNIRKWRAIEIFCEISRN